ncbi:MAG: polyribonucleotide nucleotidyltransferase [Alphaproteobacteria bacterium]|nr:polyribonucleotide nucleotidyltransferase [Alphaproteobacteria bacterium]MBQ8660669.1 polyribonucleotide nucleotidyltransferase [Alphaproteobacteria bacterium]MBR4316126.1 polyribonucleotide nucleotidyltransferase [Alphaproteobacteria bacterium]
MFNIVEKEIMWEGKKLTLQTGKIARQATGAVFATYGDTKVLATVVAAKEAKEGQDFFPLTVNYQEKFASAGKIPGSFNRREGRPSVHETLVSRLIDRPIRPLFPETFKNEVQVIATVFNYDKTNSPDIVAMIASSAALAISGIPFMGPIGAARVAYINDKFVVNPTKQELENTKLDLVVAGTEEGVLMVESEANELSEDTMLSAVETGFKSFQPIIKLIKEMKQEVGNPDWEIPAQVPEYATLKAKFVAEFGDEITKAYKIKAKLERQDALADIKERAFATIDAEDEVSLRVAPYVFSDIEAETMRGAILRGEPRIDGRDTKTVRPIECEVGILGRNHGSALFTRGETQALVSATIGVKDDEQLEDDLNGVRGERFMLHYNFPPFSVGECGKLGSPGRREIGHGKLAWRANHAMLPSYEEFPYTIRVVSDITESNGSSSMATTCGASLAMMDAGIPVKAPVAGIAMGLIKEGDQFAILTDIMGDEDHLGDMDFKVAGTKDGITALQMDIKITSITFEIMKQALAQAHEGRKHILGKMAEAIKEPRKELSQYAPTIVEMQINPKKIRSVIGSGGAVIRSICEKSNTKIEIEDSGLVKIAGLDKDEISVAQKMINDICADPEIGKVYDGEVIKLMDFGAVVSIMNGSNEGMVHISEIRDRKVKKIEDVLAVGDKVRVMVTEMKDGKTRLSIKQAAALDSIS